MCIAHIKLNTAQLYLAEMLPLSVTTCYFEHTNYLLYTAATKMFICISMHSWMHGSDYYVHSKHK